MSTDLIPVLSWNVCWGCMSADSNSKHNSTASHLAAHCKKLKNEGRTTCLDNIASFIDIASEDSDYDFVALQESKNWAEIKKKSRKLDSMGVVNYRISKRKSGNIVNIDLTSFYNKSKYKVLGVIGGNLDKTDNDTRPFLIIIFDKFIFINLHNGHGENYRPENLSEILSQSIGIGYDYSAKTVNIINITRPKSATTEITNLSNLINGKSFNIIIAGDFNHNGIPDFWQSFIPFKYSQYKNLKNIIVGTNNRPPNTCCIGGSSLRTSHSDRLYGDYILGSISGDFSFGKKNYIPKINDSQLLNASTFPTSDHLPIKAIFQYRNYPTSTFIMPIIMLQNPKKVKINKNRVKKIYLNY